MAQIASVAMTGTTWRRISVYRRALVKAEAVVAELEIFFYGPSEPGGVGQPGPGQQLSAGHIAVVGG
jgi:hypothetical protein